MRREGQRLIKIYEGLSKNYGICMVVLTNARENCRLYPVNLILHQDDSFFSFHLFIPGGHGLRRVRPGRFMLVCRKKGVSASLGSDHRETGGDQDAVDINAEISDTYKIFLKNLEILRTFTKKVDERKRAV